MKTCPNCHETNGNNQSKCFRCGTPFPNESLKPANTSAKKVCPNCKMIYSGQTSECPKCQIALKMYSIEPIASATTPTEKDLNTQSVAIFQAVAVIIAIVGVIAGFVLLFSGVGIVAALSVWGSFAIIALLFFAIVCHFKNQATIINLLKKLSDGRN